MNNNEWDIFGLVICDLKDKPHRRATHFNMKGREGKPHCINAVDVDSLPKEEE